MLSETSRAAHIRVGGGVERARYDRVAMSLHWATVILVLVQFGTSQLWGFAARPTRHVMIVSHMSFGILLAALIHNPDISCVLNIEYLVIYSDFVSFSTRPSSSRVAPEFD